MLTREMEDACGLALGRPRNAALMLAERIQASILREAMRTGVVVGDQQSLARRFTASPKVVKQALRILEGREIGRMRRGCRGGLVLRIPSVDMTAQVIALHLAALDVTVADVARAEVRFRSHAAAARPAAARLMAELFHGLRAALSDGAAAAADDNRALRLAHRIVADGRHSRLNGEMLGTVDTLSERHATGRPVIVQAVRVLEDLELVESSRGRGGGIRWKRPTATAIVRATYAHLFVRQLPVQVSGEIIWLLNGIFAALAATSPTLDTALIRALRDRIVPEAFVRGDRSSQIALFRAIAIAAGDEVLHVIVQCLFFYEFGSERAPHGKLRPADAAAFCVPIRDLADRVLARDPAGAVEAVGRCRAMAGRGR